MQNVKSGGYSHRTGKASAPAPKLRSLEIIPGENGGAIIQHNMDNDSGPYVKPQQFPFGAKEHKQAMAHVKEHMGKMGIKEGSAKEEAGESKKEEKAEKGE